MFHGRIRNDDFKRNNVARKVDAVKHGFADDFLCNFCVPSFWTSFKNLQCQITNFAQVVWCNMAVVNFLRNAIPEPYSLTPSQGAEESCLTVMLAIFIAQIDLAIQNNERDCTELHTIVLRVWWNSIRKTKTAYSNYCGRIKSLTADKQAHFVPRFGKPRFPETSPEGRRLSAFCLADRISPDA